MYTEYSRHLQELQLSKVRNQIDILADVSSSGKKRPWAEKKIKNLNLAAAYAYINPIKAARLTDCANYLLFRQFEGIRRLVSMNACKVRLCPLCTWRRSLKIYGQSMKIMEELERNGGYAYVFATFTVRNVPGSELSATIDNLMGSWQRLTQTKAVRGAVKGYWRGLEVSHNTDPASPSYDTYHPHFHAIFAVNKSYFTSQHYISQARWVALWRRSARLDYDPVIDVRRMRGNLRKGVAEVAKYAVKDADYIIPEDFNLTVATVAVLDAALHRRRLSMFGGVFKAAHRKLRLDDAEQGDLVNIGDDAEVSIDSLQAKEIMYVFSTGYGQYVRIL